MKTLKQLFKSIFRYRLSSGLTIFSLTIGFLGIIILSLYINYESSFDHFHKHSKSTYLFTFDNRSNINANIWKTVSPQIPDIEHSIIYSNLWNRLLYKEGGDKKDAVVAKCIATSEDFFKMFDFELLQGDKNKVLVEPQTVVISNKLAKKIFGTENVVGESIILRNEPYRISGVMKNMPKNTAFNTDAVISFETFFKGNDWLYTRSENNWSFHSFYQLKDGVSPKAVTAKMGAIDKIKTTLANMKENNDAFDGIVLCPIEDIHYMNSPVFTKTNKNLLHVLILLIFVLLIMGAVNFINFATAQAPIRAKSLSVQQIFGERKWKVRLLIIGESVILSLMALILAFGIYWYLAIPIQNLFKVDGIELYQRYYSIPLFIGFALCFGIIAGVYPAFYITSPPIAQAVKGKMYFSNKGKNFRHILITTQFVFTIAMLASVFVIEKQLKFWNNFDIGIDKENVLYVPLSKELKKHSNAFSEALLSHNDISDYTLTGSIPGRVGIEWGRSIDNKNVSIKVWPVDNRFFKFFKVDITAGRSFMEGESDKNNFIFNKKAVQEFGLEQPLEKKMKSYGVEGQIVGVAENFNFASLKGEIAPMTFWLMPDECNYIMLKAKATNYYQLNKFITATILKFAPYSKSETKFLDDSLNRLYAKETRIARFVEFIALWSIILALTGLLGLVIFISRDRIKEIGIRKVNGASTIELIQLLNKSIVLWISIAFVIATPIAYYAMSKWLESFAYKTTLSWWIFALAGLSALVIALLTVSWQSWRTASRNPVEALRYE